MPDHTRMALIPTSPTTLIVLAGVLGLLAGVLTRTWRLRARSRARGHVRYRTDTRKDAGLIGAERFPRKGDDDVTG